jgi:hypothetical protein
MALLDAVSEAVAYTDSPPPNEAATCLWVIYPLLQAMGYAPSEIHPQGSDSNGQYPDYTILPNKPECWYLEAKAWSIKLADGHAQQALNYANTGGKRWVVLTNGHTWRLYDNHIHGIASDKFVAEVPLTNGPEATRLFEALSKTAYLAGQVDAYARRARLQRALEQLRDENSAAVKALWTVLKKEPGLGGLSRAELVQAFGSALSSPSAIANGPSPKHKATGPIAPASPNGGDQEGVALSVAEADPATHINGKKPKQVVLPDGTTKDTVTWRAVAIEVVSWVAGQGKVPPVPFKGSPGAKRYFLNSEPNHPFGAMSAYAHINTAQIPLFLDTHRSGWDLTSHACRVCKAVGVDPAEIRVILG